MENILKCPLCHQRYRSLKQILVHLVRRHPIDQNNGSDLLPSPTQTRTRGRRNNSMALVTTVPPPAPALSLYDEYRAMSERIMMFRAAMAFQYVCHICGKVYTNGRALGGHKAQHTLAARRRAAASALVVYAPQQGGARARPRPYECQGCGRVFTCGQGLGGHKQHCKGRPQALPPPKKIIHNFDLNELPPREEDEEEEEEGVQGYVLALPWYNVNDDGGD